MKLPDGFSVRCVASEPMIRQPVSMSFDERGRLWVLQYLQYPNPAGLKPVKQDQYLRTIWDRVPEPPPQGPKGADRLTILYDPDETRRLPQAEGLRHRAEHRQRVLPRQRRRVRRPAAVPALLPRQGPRRRARRRPGGAAHRLRHGGHALARELAPVGAGRLALRRGRQHQHLQDQEPGATDRRPVVEFQQGIWRYHPKTKEFELFSEGGGNTYGLDFDKQRAGDRGHELGRLRDAAPDAGGVLRQGLRQARPAAQPARLRLLRARPVHRLQGRARHLRRHRLPGRRVSRRSSATSTSPANLLSNAVYWHKLEPNGSTFKATPRRRPADRQRHVVPAGRPDARAGRLRVRRRLVRHSGPPTSTRSTTGTRPTAASTRSSTRATPKSPTFDLRKKTTRGAGGAAEAPERLVAAGGAAAARRAAGRDRRTRR